MDVGTGSGILAILSLMYGAKHAVGTDLDPCAVDAVADNMANNGIAPEQFEMMIGNIINDKAVRIRWAMKKYDIVVANILADVLVPLTPVIVNQLKEGGIYITSGIIDDKGNGRNGGGKGSRPGTARGNISGRMGQRDRTEEGNAVRRMK